MVNLPLCSKQGNNGLKAKNFEKILFSSISKITRPVSHFWILANAKLAKRAVECLNEQLRFKIRGYYLTNRTHLVGRGLGIIFVRSLLLELHNLLNYLIYTVF